MKYYPEDLNNYMEYIEIPDDANDRSLVLKMKDRESLIQMNNFCREVKQEIGKRVKTTLHVDTLEISVNLTKNDTYLAFFQKMERDHTITPDFYELLCKAHQNRVAAVKSTSFNSPLKTNPIKKSVEVSTSSSSLSPSRATSFNLN